MISLEDLQSPEFQAVPDEAKPTALGLWTLLDVDGRGPLSEWWIAQELYRDRPPLEAADLVMGHLVMLIDAGFMVTFRAPDPESGQMREWIQLLRVLKADKRRAPSLAPPPPDARPWTSMAVERERARASARERVRFEDAARAEAWAAVQVERAPVERPERPVLLDAPPIGCPKHPDGLVNGPCGPCGTARVQRIEWLTRRVYEDKLADYYAQKQEQDETEGVWVDEPF